MCNYIVRVVFVFSIFLFAGCASHKAGLVQDMSADSYSNYQEVSGVEVAADLYNEESKTKEIFYINVNKEHYYPVNLVIQNNTENRLLVMGDDQVLKSSSDAIFRPIPTPHMIQEFERSKMAYALLGFGIFSYMSAEEANEKMAADWTEKALGAETIVSSGRRKSGFLYFKLPEDVDPESLVLHVQLEELESKTIHNLEINLAQ